MWEKSQDAGLKSSPRRKSRGWTQDCSRSGKRREGKKKNEDGGGGCNEKRGGVEVRREGRSEERLVVWKRDGERKIIIWVIRARVW